MKCISSSNSESKHTSLLQVWETFIYKIKCKGFCVFPPLSNAYVVEGMHNWFFLNEIHASFFLIIYILSSFRTLCWEQYYFHPLYPLVSLVIMDIGWNGKCHRLPEALLQMNEIVPPSCNLFLNVMFSHSFSYYSVWSFLCFRLFIQQRCKKKEKQRKMWFLITMACHFMNILSFLFHIYKGHILFLSVTNGCSELFSAT